MDAPGQTSASSVAAGIVNPITGRRFVKSWRIDELLPEARTLYRDLEAHLDTKIWYDLPLLRTLFNRGDENDWLARSGEAGYSEYMVDRPDPGRLPEVTEAVFAYAGVRHTARVDVGHLVTEYRTRLMREGHFRAEAVDYANLPEDVDRIIFCEGWRSRFNPLFSFLPPGGSKGEVLIVKTEAPLLECMFKHRVFLVPRADGTYWIGATNQNQFRDDSPTPSARQFLTDRLEEVLKVPYTLHEQQAAVRPTVRDRRPLLGQHPAYPSRFMFNGLGTKGASVAPLSSRWLYDLLESGLPVPAEVDIARFWR